MRSTKFRLIQGSDMSKADQARQLVESAMPYVTEINTYAGAYLWFKHNGATTKWACVGVLHGAKLKGDISRIDTLAVAIYVKTLGGLSTREVRRLPLTRFTSELSRVEIVFSKVNDHDAFCREKGIRRLKEGNYIRA